MSVQRFKSYPEYKDSGVEWLGRIPSHWEVRRLRHLVGRIEQGWSPDCENRTANDGEWGVLKAGCVNRGVFVEDEHKALPADVEAIPGLEIREGDLLMSRASGSRDLVGSVAVVPPCRSRLLLCDKVFRLHASAGAQKGFVAYALNSGLGRWQIEVALSGGSGLANNIAQEVVKDLIVPSPALPEQRAIAAFLDRETARIDELVAKKERLIELLQEKRTALITRAVTKGLDPNAPMKDSGVEWLGEIPAHWQVIQNKLLFAESDRRSACGEEELLTVSHITGVTRRSEKPEVTMIEAESHEGYKLCDEGELAINTMWAWMGALGIAREDGMVSPSYNVYRTVSPALFPEYYDCLCRIPLHIAEIVRHSKGIWQSRLRLYPDAFRQIVTPIPPMAEQRAIAAFIGVEADRMSRLVAKVREAIDRLRELRSALISAAVTGRIDVRPSAAR